MFRVTKYSFILLLIFITLAESFALGFPTIDLELKGRTYRLEIADNAERKAQGLMYRRYLPRHQGMLFVYDRPQVLRIWMKNTFVPLTVIWLDEQATIIDIKTLFPCKSVDCPSYGPDRHSRFVLELHAAELSRFKVGDRLDSVKKWMDGNQPGS